MHESNDAPPEGHRVFVLGGTDIRSGLIKDREEGVPIVGNNDSWRLIPENTTWSRCHVSPSYFRQGIRIDFSLCSTILNLVSDADQNPKTLRIAERITADYRDRLINDPRHVKSTRRDDNARSLQGVPHLSVPKVLRLRNPTLPRLRRRMEAEGFSFPAIVRRTGTQTGQVVGLFQTPEDLNDHFADLKGEYYFTEFVDFQWSDGLYRKMRLFSIGGEVVFDHMFIAESWLINAGMAREGIMKEREDLRAEEKRIFDGEAEHIMAPAREMMAEVARRLKLDYFGVDCSPTQDNAFLLFEANATMNIASRSTDPRFLYAQQGSLPRARAALQKLILKKARAPESKSGGSKR